MLSLALPRASVPFFVKEAHYRLLDGNTAFSTHLIELSCALTSPTTPLYLEYVKHLHKPCQFARGVFFYLTQL